MPEFVTAPYMKFQRGTPTAYHKLSRKDPDTLYFVAEADAKVGQLWIGEKLIQTTIDEQGVIKYINELHDVDTSGAKQGSVLIYDEARDMWVASDDVIIVTEMVGATAQEKGQAGLVPEPQAGDQQRFLRGDGKWASIDPYTSNIQVFDIICEKGQSHEEVIAEATKDTVLDNGDIAIVRDVVDEENNKYIYTMYLYYNEEWLSTNSVEFSSNAENVLFKEDLVTTYSIGNFIVENGSVTIPAIGKSIKEVFESIFVKEMDPEIEMPTFEIILNEAGAYEVGTKLTPSYSQRFTSGSYSYGPDTEIKLTTLSIEPNQFTEMTVEEITNYSLSAIAGYSDGTVPVNNLGVPRDELQITNGELQSQSKAITGYRAFFYGAIPRDTELNSASIRALNNGGSYEEGKTLIITGKDIENPAMFVVAVPRNSGRAGVTKVELTSYGNVNITSEYVKQENVNIYGANNYAAAAYDVWVYQPAKIHSDEIHKIILG